MNDFLQGATMLASLGVALFFLKYWRSTGDRLFAVFSVAFVVFAVSRATLAGLEEDSEARTYIYLLRALAFVLIALAIVDKNWGRTKR